MAISTRRCGFKSHSEQALGIGEMVAGSAYTRVGGDSTVLSKLGFLAKGKFPCAYGIGESSWLEAVAVLQKF